MATWYPGVGNLPPAQYNKPAVNYSKPTINYSAQFPSASVSTKPAGYGNVDLSTAAGQQAYGQAYADQIKLGGLTSRQNLGVSNAEWQAAQPQSTNTGKLSFTFGGGGGGGGGSSVPSNVLTPRTFPPYESTYVPPTPATPDPYNWLQETHIFMVKVLAMQVQRMTSGVLSREKILIYCLYQKVTHKDF